MLLVGDDEGDGHECYPISRRVYAPAIHVYARLCTAIHVHETLQTEVYAVQCIHRVNTIYTPLCTRIGDEGHERVPFSIHRAQRHSPRRSTRSRLEEKPNVVLNHDAPQSPRIAIRGLSRLPFPAPDPCTLLFMTQDVPVHIQLVPPITHGALFASLAPHLAHPAALPGCEPRMLLRQSGPCTSLAPRQLRQDMDMLTAHRRTEHERPQMLQPRDQRAPNHGPPFRRPRHWLLLQRCLALGLLVRIHAARRRIFVVPLDMFTVMAGPKATPIAI